MKKMMRNSLMSFACFPVVLALLAVPVPLFAKPPVVVEPVNTDGPLLDKMSDSGELFGDLYRIARYEGWDEIKKVPKFGANGEPVYGPITWTDPEGEDHEVTVQLLTNETAPGEYIFPVGGEPILTEDYACVLVDEDVTIEADMIVVENSNSHKQYIVSPYPSQCVQPVADAVRWGNIYAKSKLSDNRIPLVMTYDVTWKRTECEVKPELFLDGEPDGETWNEITYYKDIYWADLVQEVEFGRLNLARAPKAVLDASFDEAIRSLNAADDIKIDASGRLMVTTEIYDEFLTDGAGDALWLETVVKAIDSPKENLALYVKLMEDGHLITPAEERVPIDFSLNGGIPIDQLVALEDGPSDAPRPTIDIVKMKLFGLGHLVDAGIIYNDDGTITDTGTIVTYSIRMKADGSLYLDGDGNMDITCTEGELVDDQYCVEYEGIVTASDSNVCSGDDFPLAASFFSAAADKKGNITVDKIVYINSILGINKVVGKVYDDDGKLLVNYAKNPVYFNYNTIPVYDRLETFGQHRGRAKVGQPAIEPVYDGMFEFLEEISPGNWLHTEDYINGRVFDDVNVDPALTSDIGGFTSMSDDDLQVIKFTHTYQIPGLR
ncbi:MAG: hypothetical protein KKC76_02855 [Proteobacteria bacterium]|nr:hypothetical protein [Pseudomonadota bacterium]MBU4295668.1 hypothetical protein [Pseudomonadota bacterium]MCG2746859.1 hypothetical protein [Desulfobulbaceae bacterium]